MEIEIVVPDLGESITEATVSAWLKSSGDALAEGDILVELETDKEEEDEGGIPWWGWALGGAAVIGVAAAASSSGGGGGGGGGGSDACANGCGSVDVSW